MRRVSRSFVGPAIMSFPTLWADRLADIKTALAHFESADLASMGLPELAVYLGEFWAFHRWVWEVHFELMDPLIGNYFAFRGDVRRARHRRGRRHPVLPRNQDPRDGDRSGTVGARRCGPRHGCRDGARRCRPRRHVARLHGLGSRRVAAAARCIPRRVRVAHRGHVRSDARALGRRPDARAHDDRDVLAQGHGPRLRRRAASGHRRTGGDARTGARGSSAARPSSASKPGWVPATTRTSRGGKRSTTSTSTCAPTSRCAWPPCASPRSSEPTSATT